MDRISPRKILVTGSLAFDHIMDFPQSFEENIIPGKLKTLSVSFLVENFTKNYGGVAGNIAYNLALLGHRPSILASVGKKDFSSYCQHLQKVGVDTSVIKKVKNEFTANMFMITDLNNCQIAGFYPGAMRDDRRLSIKKVFKKGNSFDFIAITPTVPEAMEIFIKEAKELHVSYLFDPAQQIPRLTPSQLREGINGAEIVICNDYELALMRQKMGLTKRQILAQTKVLITTLGDRGSLIETKRQKIKIGIVKPGQIVDPTGAGDGYIAGFLAGYTGGYLLKVCGQIGATAATYAVENYGTQRHIFSPPEFKDRYLKAFRERIELW